MKRLSILLLATALIGCSSGGGGGGESFAPSGPDPNVVNITSRPGDGSTAFEAILVSGPMVEQWSGDTPDTHEIQGCGQSDLSVAFPDSHMSGNLGCVEVVTSEGETTTWCAHSLLNFTGTIFLPDC